MLDRRGAAAAVPAPFAILSRAPRGPPVEHLRPRHADDAPVPGDQGPAPRRDRLLPDGRLLRDVPARRRARRAAARHRAHHPRQGQGRTRCRCAGCPCTPPTATSSASPSWATGSRSASRWRIRAPSPAAGCAARGRRGGDARAGGRPGRTRGATRGRRGRGLAGGHARDRHRGARRARPATSAPRGRAEARGSAPTSAPGPRSCARSSSGSRPRELLLPDDAGCRADAGRRIAARDVASRPLGARRASSPAAAADARAAASSEGRRRRAPPRRCCATWPRTSPSRWRTAARLRRYALGDSDGARRGDARAPRAVPRTARTASRRGTLIERSTPPRRRSARGAWRAGSPIRCLDPRRSPRARTRSRPWRSATASRARCARRCVPVRDLERLLAKAARPRRRRATSGPCAPRWRRCPASRAPLATQAERGRASLWPGASAAAPSALLAPPSRCRDAGALLARRLIDDPPAIARGSRGANETGYIRAGFRGELDALRESATKGREWIAGLESEERERTGIASLKVRFHPVHGYSLEVTKAQLDRVPERLRAQADPRERRALHHRGAAEMEGRVLGANERAAALEREIFESLRQAVLSAAPGVRAAAERVAELDALASLAEVARRRRWVRPHVDAGEVLEIRGGRHPVVEPSSPDSPRTRSSRTTRPSSRGAPRSCCSPARTCRARAPTCARWRSSCCSRRSGASCRRRPRGSASSTASSRASAPRTGWPGASRPSWSRCARRRRSWRRRRGGASSSSTRSAAGPAPSTACPSPGRWPSTCTTPPAWVPARSSPPTTTSSRTWPARRRAFATRTSRRASGRTRWSSCGGWSRGGRVARTASRWRAWPGFPAW